MGEPIVITLKYVRMPKSDEIVFLESSQKLSREQWDAVMKDVRAVVGTNSILAGVKPIMSDARHG